MSLTGFEDFEANLTKLKLNNQKLSRRAIKEAAEKYEGVLERVTPIGDGIPAGHQAGSYKHLAESIVNTGLKKDRDNSYKSDVGFNKSQGWRVHFPDSGTVDQRAQKFIEKSREQSKTMVLSIFEKNMKEAFHL